MDMEAVGAGAEARGAGAQTAGGEDEASEAGEADGDVAGAVGGEGSTADAGCSGAGLCAMVVVQSRDVLKDGLAFLC